MLKEIRAAAFSGRFLLIPFACADLGMTNKVMVMIPVKDMGQSDVCRSCKSDITTIKQGWSGRMTGHECTGALSIYIYKHTHTSLIIVPVVVVCQ